MKIPDNAEKVFTGEIFDIYQWEQGLFDGSKATFERIKRPDTVLVIATSSDKIILINDTQPDREGIDRLPGGRCDKGEDSLTAAKRELLEETGYSSDTWEPFRSYEPVDKMDWNIHIYIAKGCIKSAEPTPDPGEKIELRPTNFEGFYDTMTAPTQWGHAFCSELLSMGEKEKEELRKRIF